MCSATQSYIPLIAALVGALVGALVAGFVNSLFRFYELRFDQNAKRREKQFELLGEIEEIIRMLDLKGFATIWQANGQLREKFMKQILAVKKTYESASGYILLVTVDVYDYIYQKLYRTVVMNSKIHFPPNDFDFNLESFTNDLRAKCVLMKELIEMDCSMETLNKLLYSNFINFVFSASASPGKLRKYVKEKKPIFDEIEKYFKDNGIKKFDEQ